MRFYFMFFLMFCCLVGCSTATDDGPAPEQNVQQVVGNEAVEEVANTDVASDKAVFTAPMTEEEALRVAEDVERSVYNFSILLYDDSGTVTEPDPDIMALLPSVATDRFIEENVVLHDELCGTPCYTIVTPVGLHTSWQPRVEFIAVDEFIVFSLYSSWDENRNFSYEQLVYYVFDGENWLMDRVELQEKDMMLAESDIETYLTQIYYTVESVGTAQTMDVMGQEETVYPFTQEGIAREYFVVARSGYVIEGEEGEYVPSEDDLAYWHLFYQWSDYWHEIDTENPIVADFLARVEAIDNRIYEAYEAENGLDVANEMLTDYQALYDEMYETYSASWDSVKQEEKELEARAWYFYYVNSLVDYIPAEATDVEVVLKEAETMKNRIYSMLVNESL